MSALVLDSIRLAAGTIAAGEPAPVWVHVASAGDYAGHASGPFVFDRAAFEDIVRNVQAHPSFMRDAATGEGCARVIAVDFHHASEKPARELAVAGAPAQGWVLDCKIVDVPVRVTVDPETGDKRTDGGPQLWARIDWLEPARTYIREGRYQWMSVAVWPNSDHPKTGEPIGWYMSSVALTNDPFIQGMVPIAAERARRLSQQKTSPAKSPVQNRKVSMSLQKIAGMLGVSTALILAAREDEPAAVAALEHETIKQLAHLKLAAENGAASGDFLQAVLDALGTTREEVMQKLVNLLKSASDLEAMKPEYDEMKTQQEAAQAQVAEAQVAAAMRHNKLPNTAAPALLHMRKTDPKGFAEKYPLPPEGAEHTSLSLVTQRTAQATIVNGQVGVAIHAPIAAAASRLGEAPAAPARPAQGLVLYRGSNSEVRLAEYEGRNDVERAISYLQKQNGSPKNFDALHARACELVAEARQGN